MSIAFGEVRTIPASQQAKTIMKQLVNKGLFQEQRDVWQLGAALGIAQCKQFDGENRGTFQNINSLDPDQIFASIILGLHPNDTPEVRVKHLVNYAEWGIREISRKEKIGTLDFSTLGKVEQMEPDDSGKEKTKGSTIEELTAKGESESLEFKSSFRWDVKLSKINKELEFECLKTIVGYSNSKKQGVLLIGVNPDCTIIGLENDYSNCNPKNKDGFEQLLRRKVKDNIGLEFATNIGIEFIQHNGREVCKVTVPPGTRPAYVAESGKPKAFYLRVGNATNMLNVEDANSYCLDRFR